MSPSSLPITVMGFVSSSVMDDLGPVRCIN
jgi:hypothetical protein